ncbi:MAG TPA: DUF5723 family protein [Ferruginibacter sp.]|nr:DUF5723 family protein [Ferruginibacter sp.]
MRKKLLLLALVAISLSSKAQNYAGYSSGNYTGVNSVFFNPGNVVDSRYKWSVNLFSINTTVSNNYATLKTSGLFKSFSNDSSSNYLTRSNFGNANFLIDVDAFGPSVLFNLNSKNSFALTTRGRAMVNIDKIPGNLLNTLENNGNNVLFPSSFNADNFRVTAHAWTEIGLTYGRVLIDKKNFLKGGITLKYLGGAGAAYYTLNVNADLNKDAGDNIYIQNGVGQMSYGATGISDPNNLQLQFNGSGVGADIGFVYEYRPSMITAKDENKYKFKVEAALHDLGSIQYNHGSSDADYALNTNLNPPFDTLRLDRFDKISSFADIDTALNNASPMITKTANKNGKYSMSLPTSLSGSVDYHVVSGLYINLGGMISLNEHSSNVFKTHTADYIILTPRFEGKHFGVSVPISNSSISGFNAGLSLRAGPIFIGSSSVVTDLVRGNTEQIDFHFGIVINSLQKKKRERRIKETPAPAPIVSTPNFTPPIIKPDTVVIVKNIDTDGDGIVDSLDKCPTIKGFARYNGCPIPDTDSDGVNDEIDKCPTIPGLAKYNGCPTLDSDGDGVNDDVDKCPTVPGVPKYLGCPIPDSDSDGVNDEVDQCPTIKGLAKYNGCPIPDSDSDGVNDELDKCPTLKGPASNNGCPVLKKSIIQKINIAAKGLMFQTGKAVILKLSFPKLNTVVQILKANPSLNLDIAGYTDNSGDSVKNQKLSTDRANATKAYFVKKGIAESRITTEGYGDLKPIAPNTTPQGRAKNRRVEFTLRNY